MAICRGCYREFYNFYEDKSIDGPEYCTPCIGTNKEREHRLAKNEKPNKFEQAIPRRLLEDWRAKARNAKRNPLFKLSIVTR